MTEPLVPSDCDLTGMRFMPLDCARLIDSDLFALSTGEEFKAAVALWCKSWGQSPPSSLTNDERVLARAAGVSLAEWRSIGTMALRGWVICSDGRLYHPVVAERALTAWLERIAFRRRSAQGNATRTNVTFDPTPFDMAKERAVALLDRLASAATEALADSRVPCAVKEPSLSAAPSVLKEASRSDFGSEVEGEGKGILDADDSVRVPSRVADWSRADLDSLEARLRSAAGKSLNAASPSLPNVSAIVGLLSPGAGPPCDLELDVLPAVEVVGKKAKPGSVQRWEYFRPMIVEARDKRLAGAPTIQRNRPTIVRDDDFWRAALRNLARDPECWSAGMGPRPGEPECQVPKHILDEHHGRKDAA